MDDLLHAVNWNNRWSYSGSLTTPPCWGDIQHNVLAEILPIKQEHIDALRKFTEANAPGFYEETAGNYREVFNVTYSADIVYITDDVPMDNDLGTTLIMLIASLGLIIIGLLINRKQAV